MELLHQLINKQRLLKKNLPGNRGQLLVEALIALAVASILLPALLTGLFASHEGKAQQSQRIAAIALLKESEEIVRNVREKGWSNFESTGIYHPIISGNSWSLASGNETINAFTRSTTISDVYRDANEVIVQSGGTIDPSTKRITSSVSWNSPLASSVSSVMYLTRYLNNASFIQTTTTDFNSGTHSGTVVINTSGGEVILGAGGEGEWCDPNLSIAALDLPKNGVANAFYAIEGKAFTGTGENASGISYASINISNTNPPVATISGTFDGYKTNDGIFGESDYAYLATDNNAKEVVIVDLSNPVNGKYSESGYFNAQGNGNGRSVFVSGNVGYMTDGGNTLRTFDLSSKSGSRAERGSRTLAGTGTRVVVAGSYAYVSITGASVEMQILDVSNPSSPTIVGQADVDGQGAQSVHISASGTRAYLATSASATQREFFIVDISTKTGNRPTVGSYEANGMSPKGVRTVPGNRAILVGTGGQEYQVIDITNETSPVGCGGLNIDTGVNGVSSVIEADGDAYSYIITGDSTAEFKIIEGGPGGQYASSGTFISTAYDAGAIVAYNRLIPNFILPNQTTLRLQVGVADAVLGSCEDATYYFVGPDGSPSTYFTSSGTIPLMTNAQGYANPGRCIKYKAFFDTSDVVSSPILLDVSVNYSP